MVTFFPYTCKEAPLTEIEKIRAQTMMRNNHRLQSLGLPAIASMIRKTYGGRGGSTPSSVESSAITQGESSDYHPRDDQVTEEDDEGTVKVHTHLFVLGWDYLYVLAYFVLL